MIITQSKICALASLLSVLALNGCSQTPPCEDIVEVNRQLHVCKSLSKVMNDNRYPQQAMSAKNVMKVNVKTSDTIEMITTLFVKESSKPLVKRHKLRLKRKVCRPKTTK